AVAAEKNSTLVLPFPVELLRFLERAAQNSPAAPAREPQPSQEERESAEPESSALDEVDPALLKLPELPPDRTDPAAEPLPEDAGTAFEVPEARRRTRDGGSPEH